MDTTTCCLVDVYALIFVASVVRERPGILHTEIDLPTLKGEITTIGLDTSVFVGRE